MLRLRTARGLRLDAWRKITGRDLLADSRKLIQAMHENGLVRIRHGYLSLTRSGMLVSNTILLNLFERAETVLMPGGRSGVKILAEPLCAP
jgi:oxygen-independent coproporphyrinogen-3 oxidase